MFCDAVFVEGENDVDVFVFDQEIFDDFADEFFVPFWKKVVLKFGNV